MHAAAKVDVQATESELTAPGAQEASVAAPAVAETATEGAATTGELGKEATSPSRDQGAAPPPRRRRKPLPPLTPADRARAGVVVEASPWNHAMCYCVTLSEVHERDGRQEEQDRQARAARKHLFELHRAARVRHRTPVLQAWVREEYGLRSGNYIACYKDETLIAEYFGETKQEQPHGMGFKLWTSGASYIGEWSGGMEHTMTPSVKGCFKWPDGRTYVGTFDKGKRHGRGLKTWPDGMRSYDGEFASGQEHGLGKRIYADGSVFEGRFRYGLRDGPGCMTRPDGFKEKGTFQDALTMAGGSEEDLEMENLPPLQEHSTKDLLGIATLALARAVAEDLQLYSAQLLQDMLPRALKPKVATQFVELLNAAPSTSKGSSGRGNSLSPALVSLVPSIAWSDLPVMRLAGVKFTKRDLAMLTYFLETNSAMRELSLASCGLDAPDVAVFAKVLAKSTTVQTVDMSWNSIGKPGAQALSQALSRQCKALTTLILQGCKIGGTGAEFLAEMIKQNKTLTRLDIPYNNIGPTGAAAIAEALPLNRALMQLDLRGNGLGPSGGLALADGLLHARQRHLRVVKVADNKLGEAVASAVAAAMRGTASEGLLGFNHHALKGPLCISGTLYGKKRTVRPAAMLESDEEGDEDSNSDFSDDGGLETGGEASYKPPELPGVRLLRDL